MSDHRRRSYQREGRRYIVVSDHVSDPLQSSSFYLHLEWANQCYKYALKSFDEAFQSLGPATTDTILAFEPIVNDLVRALDAFSILLQHVPVTSETEEQRDLKSSFKGVMGEIDIARTVIEHGIMCQWYIHYHWPDSVRVYNRQGHLLHFFYKDGGRLEWIVTNGSYSRELPEPEHIGPHFVLHTSLHYEYDTPYAPFLPCRSLKGQVSVDVIHEADHE